jgi:transcriptional repressor NrdR
MKCPFCGHSETLVVDSRIGEEGDFIRRRRRCEECDRRFTTFERAELAMPMVVKRNGSRSEYDPEKLRASLKLALRKRPVSTDQIDQVVRHIEEQLLTSGEREVSTEKIGAFVMQELNKLDKVAYVRFASVYKSFEDIGEFVQAIKEMQGPIIGPKSTAGPARPTGTTSPSGTDSPAGTDNPKSTKR